MGKAKEMKTPPKEMECESGKVPVIRQGTKGSKSIWSGDVAWCQRVSPEVPAKPKKKEVTKPRGRPKKPAEEIKVTATVPNLPTGAKPENIDEDKLAKAIVDNLTARVTGKEIVDALKEAYSTSKRKITSKTDLIKKMANGIRLGYSKLKEPKPALDKYIANAIENRLKGTGVKADVKVSKAEPTTEFVEKPEPEKKRGRKARIFGF